MDGVPLYGALVPHVFASSLSGAFHQNNAPLFRPSLFRPL
jgi:hypothetical protein